MNRYQALAFAFPILLAGLLRLPLLERRPMHADEAVHAAKLGALLERGEYRYSAADYHGPTLYYGALLAARLQGAARYADVSESTLRMVPAAAGVLLVAAHAFLIPRIGFPAAFWAALLTAISPAMVYYGRYFVHETLFVLFSFGALSCAIRCGGRPGYAWAVGTGLSLGLTYATKETALVCLACLLLATCLLVCLKRVRGETPPWTTVPRGPLLLAAAVGMLTAGLLFSSFLGHPRGIVDSVLAYPGYIARGLGSGTFHVQPWHYYLHLLLFFRADGGPVWTEGLIVALAAVGGVAAFRRGIAGRDSDVSRFLVFYTLLMVAAYSAIPYKVPWLLLGFLHGMILLAGMGVVRLLDGLRLAAARGAVVALLAVAGLHLGWEAWACSFRYAADPRNPWVYAHTGEDVFLVIRQLEGLASAHPDRSAIPVQIISKENLWPLPWYLRRFSAVRWWNGVSAHAATAPVILVTPDMEPALVRRLYEVPPPGQREMYVSIFDRYVELRPQVELRGYAAKWLWDDYQRLGAGSDHHGSGPTPPQ